MYTWSLVSVAGIGSRTPWGNQDLQMLKCLRENGVISVYNLQKSCSLATAETAHTSFHLNELSVLLGTNTFNFCSLELSGNFLFYLNISDHQLIEPAMWSLQTESWLYARCVAFTQGNHFGMHIRQCVLLVLSTAPWHGYPSMCLALLQIRDHGLVVQSFHETWASFSVESVGQDAQDNELL